VTQEISPFLDVRFAAGEGRERAYFGSLTKSITLLSNPTTGWNIQGK
jgi:hypothetical protein